jgi:hypothetical protein
VGGLFVRVHRGPLLQLSRVRHAVLLLLPCPLPATSSHNRTTGMMVGDDD